MTSGSRQEKSRRRLFAAMAMLLGLVMALLLLEVGLRVATPAWLEQRMQELNAGERTELGSDQAWPFVLEGRVFRQFEPNTRFRVRHVEYDHDASTDEWGGRLTPSVADSAEVVPFLGDSFTFGVGVQDDETFVSRLAAAAIQAPPSDGVSRRLLNLGVTGTALHNHLDTLELRHLELGAPKHYVFGLFMGNDLTNLRRHYQRFAVDVSSAGRGTRRQLWQANVFVYRHPVLKRLYALQFLRQKLLILLNRGERGFMDPVFLAMRADLPYLEESMTFFQQELIRLKATSTRLQFEAFFILIPDVHQLDAERRVGKATSLGLDPAELVPGQVRRSISEALTAAQIPYLDLVPCFSEVAIDGLYYTQDTHFTAAGHALAARCIQDSGRLNLFLANRSAGSSVDDSP